MISFLLGHNLVLDPFIRGAWHDLPRRKSNRELHGFQRLGQLFQTELHTRQIYPLLNTLAHGPILVSAIVGCFSFI